MNLRALRLFGFVLALLLLAGCSGGAIDAGPVRSGDPLPERVGDPDDPPATDQSAEPAPSGQDSDPAPTDQDVGDQPSDGVTPRETGGDHGDVEMSTVRLYYLAPGGDTPTRAGPFLIPVQREIPTTPRIALATLRELVDGPTAADEAMIDDISSAVPDHTLVLDVAVDDGLATVDLSREFESGGGSFSMFGRLAQVVYTLTQFPTVDEVRFQLDGRPVTAFSGEGIVLDGPVARADYRDLLPAVFVDTPAAGADIRDRVRVSGMAMVFEATFQYRLETADGTILAEGFAMSDEGMGWGSFDFTVDAKVDRTQQGALTVWEYSAKDGSVQAERRTPVVLVP